MQRIYLRGILLLLGLTPGFCSAQVYSYISESSGSPSDASYKFVIESWDTDDPSPNPCYGQSSCAVGINHRHTGADTGGTAPVNPSASIVGSAAHPQIVTLKTIGELSRYYQSIYPLPIQGILDTSGNLLHRSASGCFTAPALPHRYPGNMLG